MRNLLRILALLLAIGLVAAACGSDDDDSSSDSDSSSSESSEDEAAAEGDLPDLDGRTVTVAMENAYLPFNYIDQDTGEPAGWDYAAIDDICERLNCVPDYQTFAWEPMILAVSDGQFDMAADGITITEERAEVVDFSDGYIIIDERILVLIENEEITDVDSLIAADCPVGTQTGTTNYDTAVELVGEDGIIAFEQFPFAVQALLTGDVCAVIGDETAGQGYVGENEEEIQLVGDSLDSGELGFIFGPGSDLVAAFNAAIAEMKADGTMEALGKEYFSGAFTIEYSDTEEITYNDETGEGE
jgi:polar amino acid transport system substrate-binding protein